MECALTTNAPARNTDVEVPPIESVVQNMSPLPRITLFALASCLWYAANICAASEAQSQDLAREVSQKSIPPEKLKADLRFLHETIERVHPNMYAHTSRTQYVNILHELDRNCDHAMGASEFYLYARAAVVCLKDTHTRIEPPSNFIMPPITESMRTLGARLNKILNDDKDQKRDAPYVPAPRKKEYTGPYSHHFFPEHNTCLMVLDSFGDPSQIKQYAQNFQDTFRVMKEKGITNLIIDVRENRGGCGWIADELLTYLANKPFRQIERIEQRIVPEFFAFCEQYGVDSVKVMADEYGIDLKDLKSRGDYDRGLTVTGRIPFKNPRALPDRFKGSIYLLIGEPTFSTAANFAAAVKAFEIGTLIGQETSGEKDHYGQILPIQLPNSGLRGQVSTARLVAVGGMLDRGGVKPGYEVRQRSEDTARGVDTVLEFTFDVIRKGGAATKMQPPK